MGRRREHCQRRAMGHASKRLVTNVARLPSVSTSHLPKFPPKEALFLRDQEIPQPEFEPEVWASLQPPPPSALSAFASRIGLSSVLSTTELIQQACTHSSYVAFHQHHYPSEPAPISNAQLATIGNSLMGLFATEHINATYPYLPTRVLKAAISAHVGSMTCASVANEMGAAPLLRWRRTVRRFNFSTTFTTQTLCSQTHLTDLASCTLTLYHRYLEQ